MKARTVQKFQCLSLIVVTLNWMVPTLLCYTRTGGSVFPSHPVFQLVAFNGWRWAEYLQCPIFEVVGNTASHGILQERKLKNKTCLDDFIAAAEYLIERKYTSKKHLAIQGGSNGGLLVGACMTQRPDLYAACLPAVGVMDMLRFHKFTAGRFWVDDYGCSETSQEEFRALAAYSPYHNIKDQTEISSDLGHQPRTQTTESYQGTVLSLLLGYRRLKPVLIPR